MAPHADDVVIVEAVRTPLGRRNGGLSMMHPSDLLGVAVRVCVDRAGLDPSEVGQVIGGCVEQVGEQASNVVRYAWLDAGLPESVAAVSIDSACGSAQQAVGIAAALVKAGVVSSAIGCGVASMSRIPIATSFDAHFAPPPTRRVARASFLEAFVAQTEEFGFGQFGCAERLAELHGITRADADQFGYLSQQRAARAWSEGGFAREVVPIGAPTLADDGTVAEDLLRIARDEGLRETTLDGLAALKPVAREGGVHTAGTSSQISDGAAAVLLMSAARAAELGLRARARIVDQCHVGVDPVLMLSGPIDATELLLQRNKLTIENIDVFEVNEAFAAVPLAWRRHFDADPARLNPNGGAIALGHPVGATGARLIATLLHELERADVSLGLVTMCAGGGLGTGTLIERL